MITIKNVEVITLVCVVVIPDLASDMLCAASTFSVISTDSWIVYQVGYTHLPYSTFLIAPLGLVNIYLYSDVTVK